MLSRYELTETPLTINGFSLTDDGYRAFAAILRSAVYGEDPAAANSGAGPLYDAVKDKNWHWLNDYGMLNDVHVYGRRVEPFGVENYPEEILKIRQMTALRDARVHELARGAAAAPVDDAAQTLLLAEIDTNFNLPIEFLDVQRAIEKFELPEGFEIDLFASESEFPELRNPAQMSFDNRGRLWVAVAPSYPHWRPGDDKPDDKLLIFEDADRDGRADSVSVFADGLHLPFGFELAPVGVYLAQQPNLVLLADDDGDGRADRREILLHGFDSHDSHHAISAFAADASGAIYMSEGVFLHSQDRDALWPATRRRRWRMAIRPRNLATGTLHTDLLLQSLGIRVRRVGPTVRLRCLARGQLVGSAAVGQDAARRPDHQVRAVHDAAGSTDRRKRVHFVSPFPGSFPGRFPGQQHDRFPRHQAACGGG